MAEYMPGERLPRLANADELVIDIDGTGTRISQLEAELRRVEQERDRFIAAAEICERALDRVSAKLTTAQRERDLARAELASARQELDALRLQRAPVLDEIQAERDRQDAKWGEQNHPDGTGPAHGHYLADASIARDRCDREHRAGRGTWEHILTEEYHEAMACEGVGSLRDELIQVAAVAVAWVEAMDRRNARGSS